MNNIEQQNQSRPFFPSDCFKFDNAYGNDLFATSLMVDCVSVLCDLVTDNKSTASSDHKIASQLCLLSTNVNLLYRLLEKSGRVPADLITELQGGEYILFDMFITINSGEEIHADDLKDLVKDIKETISKIDLSNKAITSPNNLNNLFSFSTNINAYKDDVFTMAEGIFGICNAIKYIPSYDDLTKTSTSNKATLISLALSLKFELGLFIDLVVNTTDTEKYASVIDKLISHKEIIDGLPIILDDATEKTEANNIVNNLIGAVNEALQTTIEEIEEFEKLVKG